MSEEIKNTISNEVIKDTLPIQSEDPTTANFYRDMCRDYKEATYKLLRWVDREYHPNNILYPGSGFDIIPKLAFGHDRVIHTSLEEHGPGGITYFDQLGTGKKVIADNASLPFLDNNFNLILLLDSPFSVIGEQRDELLRVLADNGLLIFAENLFEDDQTINRIEHYKKRTDLYEIAIPSDLQQSHLGFVRFYLMGKNTYITNSTAVTQSGYITQVSISNNM